jgi:enolase-phosphatase E1
VDFVYKTLFPFASARAQAYLREHFAEPEVRTIVAELRAEHGTERWNNRTAEEEIASASAYVHHLIEQDRKVTPLKTLQGKIWEEGFKSGELKGHVYEDVPRAFERWKSEGKRIAIFSSGSVLAQKLLFGHSSGGDLTRYIDAYFDTTTGPKRKTTSYAAIANALGIAPESVLFVSDVTAELDAARGAGMETALMLRPGVEKPNETTHACIEDFRGI